MFVGIGTVMTLVATMSIMSEITTKESQATIQDSTHTKNQYERHPPPRKLTMLYGEPIKSVADAKQMSTLNVKTSSTIPSQMELKMVNARVEPANQVDMITQIYMPKQFTIDSESTFEYVMNNNGVIIVQEKEQFNFDSDKWIDDYVKNTPEAQLISINGHKAVGFNNDPIRGARSEVIFYDGNTQIILVSLGQSLSSLTQIAASLQ